jgi:hypothetical protein
VITTAGFTAAEIREFVHEYQLLPQGQKRAWLAARGVPYGRLRRWRLAVYSGGLDRGLVPRDADGMTIPPVQRTALEAERARERAAHEAEVARLQRRVLELEAANGALGKANDALGKAIGLLHEMNEREPGAKTTTGPNDSSPPKTS